MPFTPQAHEEKPYNACLDCAHIGRKCDGPNFLAMDVERWCEWCRLRKEYLGWTNAHVAELADLSKISVDRVMSGSVKDLRISTMQAITKALVNGSWGQYPCAMSGMGESETVYLDNPLLIERVEHAERECKRLEAALESARADDLRIINYLKEQIRFKEEQMVAKDKLLDERRDFLKRKDKAITVLAVFLALALLVIFIALVVDKLNPEVGFIWLDKFTSLFNGAHLPFSYT